MRAKINLANFDFSSSRGLDRAAERVSSAAEKLVEQFHHDVERSTRETVEWLLKQKASIWFGAKGKLEIGVFIGDDRICWRVDLKQVVKDEIRTSVDDEYHQDDLEYLARIRDDLRASVAILDKFLRAHPIK